MSKLMIVEDDVNTASMISHIAQLVSIEVVGVAKSWREALDILEGNCIDFATLDIDIEGNVDGIEVGKMLQARGIGFTFVTSLCDVATIREATQANPISYIVKPINKENMVAAFLLMLKKNALATLPAADIKKTCSIGIDGMIYNGKMMVKLSRSERAVLTLLIRRMGVTIPYEEFFIDGCENEASLRNIILKLRKKCPDLMIQNVKEVGYCVHYIG
ncbi:MAG: hypothetical protein KU37_06895 [Sulfuricurvum sp. PC08-66]|nr:MAG: hypothetical protein KU37_06895 [Sulfuricurvum sp. PC08-66]